MAEVKPFVPIHEEALSPEGVEETEVEAPVEEESPEAETTEESEEVTETPKEEEAEGSEESEEAKPEEPEESPEKPEASEPEAPEEKFILKVDGAEEEVTREEAVRLAQMGRAAHKRMEEAARQQQSINKVLEDLMKDPLDAFRQIAAQQVGDTRAQELTMQAIQRFVQPFAEEAALPEEDRKLRQIQRENEALDRKKAEWKEQQKLIQQQELEQYWRNEYESRAQKIFDLGIPDNQVSRQILSDVFLKASEADYDLSPEDATVIVKQEYRSVLKSLPTGEMLKDDPKLQKQLQNKAAADAVEAVKQKRQPTTKADEAEKPPTRSRRRKEHLNPNDFFGTEDIFSSEK